MKLSITYALSQSTKLSLHERNVQEIAANTKYLPQSLARHGEVDIKGKEIAKLMGYDGMGYDC